MFQYPLCGTCVERIATFHFSFPRLCAGFPVLVCCCDRDSLRFSLSFLLPSYHDLVFCSTGRRLLGVHEIAWSHQALPNSVTSRRPVWHRPAEIYENRGPRGALQTSAHLHSGRRYENVPPTCLPERLLTRCVPSSSLFNPSLLDRALPQLKCACGNGTELASMPVIDI